MRRASVVISQLAFLVCVIDGSFVEKNFTIGAGEALLIKSPGYPSCCERAAFIYHIYCYKCTLFFEDVSLPVDSELKVHDGPNVSSPVLKSAFHIVSVWLGPNIYDPRDVYTVQLTVPDAVIDAESTGVRFRATSKANSTGQVQRTTTRAPNVSVNGTTTPENKCFGQLACPDGSCVDILKPCPGEPCDTSTILKECDDGSCIYTYERCPGECLSYEQKCHGKCIQSSYNVCPDPGCTVSRPYKCANSGSCYSDFDKCDGHKACNRGTDEENCPTHTNDYDTEDSGSSEKSWPWYWIVLVVVAVAIVLIICAVKLKDNKPARPPFDGSQPPIQAGASTQRTDVNNPTVVTQSYPVAPANPLLPGANANPPVVSISTPSAPPAYFDAMSPQYDIRIEKINDGLPSYSEAVGDSTV